MAEKEISAISLADGVYEIKDTYARNNYLHLSGGNVSGDLSVNGDFTIGKSSTLTAASEADDKITITKNTISYIPGENGDPVNFKFPSVSQDLVLSDKTDLTGNPLFTLAIKEDLSAIYADLNSKIAGGVHFIGLNTGTTKLTDGGNETPTITGGYSTKSFGDIVMQNETGPDGKQVTVEYIYTKDSRWEKIGANDTSNFGGLAYKNNASVSYTPSGTISVGTEASSRIDVNLTTTDLSLADISVTSSSNKLTFTGTPVNLTCTLTADQITNAKLAPVFAGESTTITPTIDALTVAFNNATWSASNSLNVTPTFTGTQHGGLSASSITYTETNLSNVTFTGTSVNASSFVTVTLDDGQIANAIAAGTSETLNTALTAATVTNGVLSFGSVSLVKDIGSITITPKYGVSDVSYKFTASVSGTYKPSGTVAGKYSKTTGVTTQTFTPSGTISKIEYTPAGNITGTQTLTPNVHGAAYTPTGTVTISAFTPTGTTKVAFTPAGAITGTLTPTGNITVAGNITLPSHSHTATFSGSTKTITVS